MRLGYLLCVRPTWPRTCRGRIVSCCLIIASLTLNAIAGTGQDRRLPDGFTDPPLSARPAGYWVWSNGLTDRVQMERELRAFKAVGLSGVYIFDVGARSRDVKVPSGPAFMGS